MIFSRRLPNNGTSYTRAKKHDTHTSLVTGKIGGSTKNVRTGDCISGSSLGYLQLLFWAPYGALRS